jgi:hypothetical protein
VPWAASYETNEPVNAQHLLKVLSAKIVLALTETEPEKRTKTFPIQVYCAGILAAGNTLQNQKTVSVFYKALSARFAALQKCPKHFPAIGIWK